MSERGKGKNERDTPSLSRAPQSPRGHGEKQFKRQNPQEKQQCARSEKYQKSCHKYLKGTCTDPLCDYWHASECQKYQTKEGCNFGEKLVFYMPSKVPSLTRNQKREGKTGKKAPVPWCGMLKS